MYMIERLGIPESDVPFLREQYFKMYGTTLRGLEERHNVDKEDFLAFVHDLPLQDFLNPDPVLREVIASLPTRNLIFTNADVPTPGASSLRSSWMISSRRLWMSTRSPRIASPCLNPLPSPGTGRRA